MFTFTSSPTQLHIFDTSPNPRGLCSLSPSCDNSVLAMPGTKVMSAVITDLNTDLGLVQVGQLQLVDLQCADSPPLEIPAHDSALSIIQLNVQVSVRPLVMIISYYYYDPLQGTRVATASTKGTLIRVFDTTSGSILTELRR